MNLGRVLLNLSDGRAPQRVFVIGHSLGGAVAQLAALWATLRFPRADVRCISFGAPRVGNHAWKVWSGCLAVVAGRAHDIYTWPVQSSPLGSICSVLPTVFTLKDLCKSRCVLSACLQRAFKMMVGIGSLRIVNRADPIPSVPAAAGLRYRHVGPPVWFDKRGMHLHERPIWEQARCSMSRADAPYAAQHL